MAALSSGPLLTTASSDLASQIFCLFTTYCNQDPELGSPTSWPCALTHGLLCTKLHQMPLLCPSASLCFLCSARSSLHHLCGKFSVGFSVHWLGGCSGRHIHLWTPGSQDETGPEVLLSAVRVNSLCTAPLEHSPVFDKMWRTSLPVLHEDKTRPWVSLCQKCHPVQTQGYRISQPWEC